MVIDTRGGRILHSAETDSRSEKSRHPYKEWMEKNVRRIVPFEDLSDEEVGRREMDDDSLASFRNSLTTAQKSWTLLFACSVKTARKAVGSMGDDTPFAVLSSQPASFTITSASSSRR